MYISWNHEYLCSISDDSVLAAFQQTIEKLEELEDLDALFVNCCDIIETAISTDNLDLVNRYLEYVSKLATMINRSEELGGSLVFMLNYASELKDTERVDRIKQYMDAKGITAGELSVELDVQRSNISHI